MINIMIIIITVLYHNVMIIITRMRERRIMINIIIIISSSSSIIIMIINIIIISVSFHNFKSQNFKLSVSNPKSKYVAYVSVLSRISICQSLGSKNKFEILKTYRSYV